MNWVKGESLSREWQMEKNASELESALNMIKDGDAAGIDHLIRLAEGQSGLAMAYLGSFFANGSFGIEKDPHVAEDWLKRSSELNSIEGSYCLAAHYINQGKDELGLKEYERLSDLNYAPAQFALGSYFYSECEEYKGTELPLKYFRMASRNGHFPSIRMISYRLMKESESIVGWVHGAILRLVYFIPFVFMYVSNKHSDRFRT